MKNFIALFILAYIGLFIGGTLIFENFSMAIFVFALILAGFLSTFLSQETRMEELEQRIQNLETPCENEDEPKIVL